jgi:hypothetical protein
MSRGLGKIERKALAIIESADEPLSSREVAARVYEIRLTRKQVHDAATELKLPVNKETAAQINRGLRHYLVKESQSVAVRRALNKLKKHRHIFDIGRRKGRNRFWMNERQYCIQQARAWQIENKALAEAGRMSELMARIDTKDELVERGLDLLNSAFNE